MDIGSEIVRRSSGLNLIYKIRTEVYFNLINVKLDFKLACKL